MKIRNTLYPTGGRKASAPVDTWQPLRRWSRALSILALGLLPLSAAGQSNSGGSHSTADHDREVIGYVPQWDAWKGSSAGYPTQGILNQLNIDYSQYTILNFSFFGVAVDGSLHSADHRNKQIYLAEEIQQPNDLLMSDVYSSWDYWILNGEITPLWYITPEAEAAGYEADGAGWRNEQLGIESDSFPIPFPDPGGPKGLLDLCRENGVKAMASIGGWSMCKHFPEMAADPEKRARFIADCQKLIAMGFDGIDLDWEYPGPYAGMNFTGSEADFANFELLVAELRAAIGPDKLITAAFSADPNKLAGFDWSALSQTMDYFNIMAYDYHGGWSNIAGHNSPLYGYPGEEGGPVSWHNTLQGLASLGVDLSKVNMGLAFYGRGVVTDGMGGVNAPTIKSPRTIQPDGPIVTAADYTNWAAFESVPYYSYIVNQSAGWNQGWDSDAKVPYLAKEGAFLSYDDPRSVGLKAQYVRENNLGGVIIWTAFGDVQPGPVDGGSTKLPASSTSDAPLANVLNAVLAGEPVPGESETDAFLSVGPATTVEGDSGTTDLIFTVSLSAPRNSPVELDFSTTDGTALADSDFLATSGSITFPAGVTRGTIRIPVIGDEAEETQEYLTLVLSNPSGATLATPNAIGGIADDDGTGTPPPPPPPVTPTLSILGTTVVEGNVESVVATANVTLTGTASDTVSVDYATENGTALEGSDYSGTTGTLTFAPGTRTVTLDLPIIGDTIDESDESFSIRLTNPLGATLETAVASITITDDDDPVAPPPGPGPLFGLSALPTDRPLVMGYVNALRSETGLEQSLSPAEIADAFDSLTWEGYDVIVHAFGEPLSNGSIGEDLGNFKAYQADLIETAHQNDTAVVLSLGGAYPARLATQFTNASSEPVTRAALVANIVDYVKQHGYDGVDIDWEFPNATDEKDSLTALMADLHTALKAESPDYIVMFGTGPGYYMGSYDFAALRNHADFFFYFGYDWKNPQNGPITKPGSGPQWTTANDTLFEQSVRGGIQYVIDQGFPAERIICGLPFYGSGNTSWSAVRDEYFANQASYDATIDPDALEVQINNQWFTTPTALKQKMDALLLPESSVLTNGETIRGVGTWEIGHEHWSQPDLSNAFVEWLDAYSVGTPTPAQIRVDNVTLAEDGGDALFVVSLDKTVSTEVRVDYFTAPGTAINDNDYTPVSGSVTFAPGETGQSVVVPIIDDSIEESDETFTLTLSNLVGDAIMGVESGICTIVDNDAPIPAPMPEWTRHYASDPGGNPGGSDGLTVAFVEPTPGQTWGSGFSGAFTITNNGNSPASEWTVTFEAPWTTSGSGNAGSWTIDGTLHSVVQPSWGGYSIAAGQTVTIDFTGAGTWTSPTNLMVNGENDGGNSSLVTLGKWLNANALDSANTDPDADASASIGEFLLGTDPNDPGSLVSLLTEVQTIDGADRLVATFVVDPLAEGVEYRIESTTDTNTWSVAENVMVLHDTMTRPDGSLTVRWASSNPVSGPEDLAVRLMARKVGTVGNGFVGAIPGGAVTPPPPPPVIPEIGISEASLTEPDSGTSGVTLTITLNEVTTVPVQVDYATEDATAVAGTDYTAASGTLTIPAGANGASIDLTILGDTVAEATETFGVRLFNPSNASLANSLANVTIADNDDATPPPPPPPPPSGEPLWTHHYTLGSGSFDVAFVTPTGGQVWGSGFSGKVELTNTGESPVTEWTLQFVAPWSTTGSGNAGSWTIDGDVHTVTQPTWIGYSLAPGETANLDFTGQGAWSEPNSITVDGQDPGSGATGNLELADWLAAFGLDDSRADNDADGLDNITEFLLGTDPTILDPEELVYAELRSLNFDGSSNDHVVITLEVNPKAAGVEYVLELSDDGINWTRNTGQYVLHTTTAQSSGLLRVEWRSAEPAELADLPPYLWIEVREVETETGSPPPPPPPPPPPAEGAPNTPTLSVLKDWNDGVGHRIEWNTWGGEAATSWTLYQNGEPIHSETLTGAAPQNGSYDIDNSIIGKFTYEVEVANSSGATKSAEVVFLTDHASTIEIVGKDTPAQVSQITLPADGGSLTLTGGTPPYTATVNNPRALSASISGEVVSLTGTAGLRSGLKIEDAAGNVRLVGVRTRNSDGSIPGLPPHLGIGSVSEDSVADLEFWSDYLPGTLRNKWVDYRYIYINGGVKRKGVGWRTWTNVDGDRMRVFVRESVRRGMIPVVVWYNIPDGGESYTRNLEHIQDPEYMRGYYEDLAFAIDIANQEAGDDPVVWVLEPDFIGYMAQNNENPLMLTARTDAAYEVGVLNGATDPVFPNTMRGLIASVNYLLANRANNAVFGWQFNLWAFPAGGWDPTSQITGKGLIRITDRDGYTLGREKVFREGQLVADYYTSAGILTHGAQFISIDKYGLDAGAEQKNDNPAESTWFWHAGHWANYLHYVDALHTRTGVPVMLWQLPVGHINSSERISPYTGETFPDHPNQPRDWEDSAPTFFFGDRFVPGAGNRYSWFSDTGGGHADVTVSPDGQTIVWGEHLTAAQDAGVFAALFGDGVGNSTRARGAENTDEFWWISKVQEYYENPVPLIQ